VSDPGSCSSSPAAGSAAGPTGRPLGGLAPQAAAAGRGTPRLCVEQLHAGYGRSEVLHGLDLLLRAGQSMCLVGPNGAGKSTVLNALFGMADIGRGTITIEGRTLDRAVPAAERLARFGMAYVLQDSSVFPDLTVEQNLRLGGYVLRDPARVTALLQAIFEEQPRLAERRRSPARVLSGGERRLLEIGRALMTGPRLLLIDEPSIGLEPRAVGLVFETLKARQEAQGLSILLVEQNVRQGLGFADLGCVMVAGRVVAAGSGVELLRDRHLGDLFLGR
jgi:branched-chain amino acid transport system ATP-binding protein